MAERHQLIILLCKVETRSAVGNIMIIWHFLDSTLHNDMLVIKEQFYLPAFFIKQCYFGCIQGGGVRDKDLLHPCDFIIVSDTPKLLRIMLA
jgi:hypothetical protein